MGEQTKKKKIIFLSHSGKDKRISDALYNLMNEYMEAHGLEDEYEIFYSPKSLIRKNYNRRDWRKAIIDNVKKSHSVVVLWTPNSINNRWVNYEIGMATAFNEKANKKAPNKKEIIALGIRGIDYNIMIPGQQVISIENEENIIIVLHLMFARDEKSIKNWVELIAEQKKEESPIKKLLNVLTQKCIYFVGSKQKEWTRKDRKHSEQFVRELSKALIKGKYRLSSYPTVEHIGKIVAQTAMKHQADYEISGLYMFDETVGQLAQKWGGDVESWNRTMERFRKIYLDNKHCMVIIGGGENTENEYKVAVQQGVQVFPIPCFGGFGKRLFESLIKDKSYLEFRHPCINCNHIRNKDWECEKIDDFVLRFKDYSIIELED